MQHLQAHGKSSKTDSITMTYVATNTFDARLSNSQYNTNVAGSNQTNDFGIQYKYTKISNKFLLNIYILIRCYYR